MSDSTQNLAVTLFSEILAVDQLARSSVARVLPKGMELSHFSVLNHLAHVAVEKSPAQLAQTFHLTLMSKGCWHQHSQMWVRLSLPLMDLGSVQIKNKQIHYYSTTITR